MQCKVLCWQFAQRCTSLQGKIQLWYVFAYLASKDLGQAFCTQIYTSGKKRKRKAFVPLNAYSSHLGNPPKDFALKIIGQTCLRMRISRVPLEVKLHPSKETGFLFLFFLPFIFQMCKLDNEKPFQTILGIAGMKVRLLSIWKRIIFHCLLE